MTKGDFIAYVAYNNPEGFIDALSSVGVGVSDVDEGIEYVNNLKTSSQFELLSDVPFIDRGDWFSNYVKSSVSQYKSGDGVSAEAWMDLGVAAITTVGSIFGNSGTQPQPQPQPQLQPQPQPPPQMDMSKYIPWALGFAALLVLLVFIPKRN